MLVLTDVVNMSSEYFCRHIYLHILCANGLFRNAKLTGLQSCLQTVIYQIR